MRLADDRDVRRLALLRVTAARLGLFLELAEVLVRNVASVCAAQEKTASAIRDGTP